MQLQLDRAANSQGLALPSKKHPAYTEHEYFVAVEAAFTPWEAGPETSRRVQRSGLEQ